MICVNEMANLLHDKIKDGGYAEIAAEYYNVIRHPTCHNFREASINFISSVLCKINTNGIMLEVGAGYSVLGQALSDANIDFRNLILSDSSSAMLTHSEKFLSQGAMALVADATAVPLRSGTIDLIVASLGDPYNTSEFWSEVYRCLVPGGYCLFTTPSFEWASQFRSVKLRELAGRAFFELRDGRSLYVPSLVYSVEGQKSLLGEQRLVIKEVMNVPVNSLRGPISDKLRLKEGTVVNPVTGYVVTKRD
jgi:SAM-dependent methyltransferase